MAVEIRVRRDTTANWTLANPILAAGEPALDLTTGLVKYGNGVNRWLDLPTAAEGPPGEQGAQGISAYQVAINNGFVGTEADWLASLVGPEGPAGSGGGTGGGADGLSAYEVAVANGFVGTEAEWLISLKGTNGTNGFNGTNGTDGEDGLDAFNYGVWPRVSWSGTAWPTRAASIPVGYSGNVEYWSPADSTATSPTDRITGDVWTRKP